MMKQTIFQTNAAKLRELETAQNSGFLDLYDKLAFPGGLERQRERLRQNHPEAIEMAVRFLEADPFFFRSGYIKEDFIRFLKRAPLSEEQQSRLRHVLLAKIDSGDRREFRAYCKLARVVQTPAFLEEVESRVQVADEAISKRARWMLDALKPLLR